MKKFDNIKPGSWAPRSWLSRSLTITAAALLATTAVAHEESPKYTMTIIKNVSYSQKVARGDYDEAIEKLTARKYRGRETYASKTNLCVAYTKSGDLDNAQVACNAALDQIRARKDRSLKVGFLPEYTASGYRAYLALALSNRGVLHAVNGDEEQARSDFMEALELEAGLSAPRINLARLDDTKLD